MISVVRHDRIRSSTLGSRLIQHRFQQSHAYFQELSWSPQSQFRILVEIQSFAQSVKSLPQNDLVHSECLQRCTPIVLQSRRINESYFEIPKLREPVKTLCFCNSMKPFLDY